jgi:hypothetical protein
VGEWDDIFEGQKPEDPVVEAIRGTPLVEILKPMKADSWVRISGLPYLCAREEALCAIHGIDRKKEESGDSAFDMGYGTNFHAVLQNRILGPRGLIAGEWECEICGTRQGAAGRAIFMPTKCHFCGSGRDFISYVEPYIVDKEKKISGHSDGFYGEDGAGGIWEFKTTGFSSFSKLKTMKFPWPAHILQAAFYACYLKAKRARILYVNREASGRKDRYLRFDVPMTIEAGWMEKAKTPFEMVEEKLNEIARMRTWIACGVVDAYKPFVVPRNQLPDTVCPRRDSRECAAYDCCK